MIDERSVLEAFKNAGKPMRPGDIAKKLNVDSKELAKIIKLLKESGKLTSPKRCFYEAT